MANWIKWLKNKDIVTIMCVLIGAVVISALCTVFIVEPWSAIVAFVIGIAAGFIARKLIIKAIDNWDKNQEQKMGD